MRYLDGTVENGDPLGSATCLCEPEDAEADQCTVNADHSQVFSNSFAFLNMYCLTSGGNPIGMSSSYFDYILSHELGHLLGLGHQYNQPYPSVMGDPIILSGTSIFNATVDLDINSYPEELLHFQKRYPCGCTLTNNLRRSRDFNELTIRQTGEFCRVCAGKNTLNG